MDALSRVRDAERLEDAPRIPAQDLRRQQHPRGVGDDEQEDEAAQQREVLGYRAPVAEAVAQHAVGQQAKDLAD